jgi:hypothetical protein
MRYFNEKAEPISVESIDLEKGFLVPFTAIKEDATPIDDITKFAWVDEDYEDAMMYVLNQEVNYTPTELDKLDARLTYVEMMTGIMEV